MANQTLLDQTKSDLSVAKNKGLYSDQYKMIVRDRRFFDYPLRDGEYFILYQQTLKKKNDNVVWHEITNYGKMVIREFTSFGSLLKTTTYKGGLRLTDAMIKELLDADEDMRYSLLISFQTQLDIDYGLIMMDFVKNYAEMKCALDDKPQMDIELKAAREEIAALRLENETLSLLRDEHQREMNAFKCTAMDIITKLV